MAGCPIAQLKLAVVLFTLVACWHMLAVMRSRTMLRVTETNPREEGNDSSMTDNSAPASKKLILFWTQFWGFYHRWSLMFADTKRNQCPLGECTLSVDKQDLATADAVVFHVLDLARTGYHMPRWRPAGQVWVLFSLESPVYRYMNEVRYNLLNGVFNFTMTYRWDSDIPVPYGLVLSTNVTGNSDWSSALPNDTLSTSTELPVSTKKRLVAWSVSNCVTKSHREQYVLELNKYIHVDIYGSCTGKRCGDRESVDRQFVPDRNAQCHNVLSTYKFFLAFENAICTDYITEKFFRSLALGIVPVVLGGGDYSRIAPPNSYIDALTYTPSQLADYLNYLDTNSTAYRSYHQWRGHYQVIASHPMRPLTCGLCHRLHRPDHGANHVINDMSRLFEPSQCQQ